MLGSRPFHIVPAQWASNCAACRELIEIFQFACALAGVFFKTPALKWPIQRRKFFPALSCRPKTSPSKRLLKLKPDILHWKCLVAFHFFFPKVDESLQSPLHQKGMIFSRQTPHRQVFILPSILASFSFPEHLGRLQLA